MKIREDMGLTFDDVLLVPKRSPIRSRKDVDTSSQLTKSIRLHIPIVSANMDTVTEHPMAISMAEQGGLGILHRFMSIEQQAEMVARVKRTEGFVVEHPATIAPDATINDARQQMIREDIGGLMVVDPEGHLLGVISTRDVLLTEATDQPLSTVMTPRERLVVSDKHETLEEARLILYSHRLEKLPLVNGDNKLVGLVTARDIIRIREYPHATKDQYGRLRVGVAVGVKGEDLDRARACVAAGADLLVLDIAHGHSDRSIEMIQLLKQEFPRMPLIAGNVATAEGTYDLIQAGADAIKIGIGPGSTCTTRIVTGFGIPQLTAIADCAAVAQGYGIPIIADGGIRSPGDLVKALAAGAQTGMLGGALAGTDESPGRITIRNGQRFKAVRGMASLTANIDRRQIERGLIPAAEWDEIVPEGVEAVVPYRGSVVEILHRMVGGLRSGLSYAGAHNIVELQQNAEFIRMTPSGGRESGPHDNIT